MPNSTAEKPKFYTDKVAKAAIAKLEAENATLKAQLKARSATPAVKPVAQDLIAKQDPATKSNLTGIDRAIEAHKKSNK